MLLTFIDSVKNYRKPKLAILLLVSICLNSVAQAGEQTSSPAVILKLDDFRGNADLGSRNIQLDRWQRVIDFLLERKIKSSFGMIGDDLEIDKPGFFAWCREMNGSGLIEFWNHGYRHKKIDFNGTNVGVFAADYDTQLDSFQKTQKLAREKLGFSFTAFGSPYNASNVETAKVLARDPDIKVWLFGKESKALKGGFEGLVMERTINMESPVHNPNYGKFVAKYERGGLGDVIVLQGHPNGWSDRSWISFVNIIDFLQAKGSKFTTPTAYMLSKR